MPNIAYYAACVLVPLFIVFFPEYPPMTDLPQHAAQVGLAKQLLSGTSPFQELFDVQLFTPYILAYLLVFILSYVMSVVLATKVVVVATLIAIPLSMTLFYRTVTKTDSSLKWLFLCAPYGVAFEWGFLTFLTGIPLGFLYLTYLYKQHEHNTTFTIRHFFFNALFLYILCFTHILIFIAFFLLGAALTFNRNITHWLKSLTPVLTLVPTLIIWHKLKSASDTMVHEDIVWYIKPDRALFFVSGIIGESHLKTFSNIFGIFTLALPFIIGQKITRKIPRILPFLGFSIAMFTVPISYFGTYLIVQRYAALGLPLYFLCFEKTTKQDDKRANKSRLIASLPVVLGCALAAQEIIRSYLFSQESSHLYETIKQCPKNSRLVALISKKETVYYNSPTFIHYGAWFQGEEMGISDFSFSSFFAQPLRYSKEHRPNFRKGFEFQPLLFSWSQHSDSYQCFLSRSAKDIRGVLLPPEQVELKANNDLWWLYTKRL